MTKAKSKPYAMTESDRSLVAMALRSKAEGDERIAADAAKSLTGDAWQSYIIQFQRQAKQARELANRIDAADLVDVWPYDED